MIKGMINPFVNETLGPRPSERPHQEDEFQNEESEESFDWLTPFNERSQSEQEYLFYKIEGLVAERRRLAMDLLAQKRTEDQNKGNQEPAFVIKKVGPRYVSVPAQSQVKSHETYRSDSVIQGQKRLEEVKKQLKQFGQIPGMHEAYEKKLHILYYFLKTLRDYEKKKERIAEIKAILNNLYESSRKSVSGSVDGLNLIQAEKLEAEKAGLEEDIGLMEGRSPELIKLQKENERLLSQIESIKAGLKKKDGSEDEDIEKELGSPKEELEELEQQVEKNKAKINQILGLLAAGQEIYRPYLLRSYAEDVSRGRLVNIPQVERITEMGLEKLRDRQPFLLSGHLGSGKTEMACHIAKLFMIENGVGYDPETQDPNDVYDKLQVEIFSGGEDTTVYDLIGKQQLTGRSNDDPALVAIKADEIFKELQKTHYHDIPKEEIIKILLGKADITVTRFKYGPLGRAIRDGKPIVIDEVNMIPAEVLGRLNAIMLAGVGDKIALQENGHEVMEVKPGFAILGTCNFGEIYAGIQAMNAAFKSRWVMREVSYPEVAETYDIILATLIQKDRLRFPPNFPKDQFDSLARLAVTVYEIQQIFSKKTAGRRFMAVKQGVNGEPSALEQNVISTRDLMRKIINPWKKNNFDKSLEHYIAEVLASASNNIDDQKLMTELFLRRGFFMDWNEEDFRRANIENVSQREIDILRATMGTNAYKEADAQFGDLLEKSKGRIE